MSDSGPVLVVGEVSGSSLRPVSLELVTLGRRIADELGTQLVGLLAGSGVSDAAAQFAAAGLDRVVVADDSRLGDYTAERATAVVATAVDALGPAVVLIPGTTAGRDYAPRLAARFQTGLAADCVDLSLDGGALVCVRPVLGGRVQTAVRLASGPIQMATVRPGSFDKAAASDTSSTPVPLAVELSDADLRVAVKDTVQEAATGATKLDTAKSIVAGGRGLKEPDNFKLVEDLASVLDAAVGATRAVVDAGWRPHHEQIGQTGRTVSPRLYIAVGVSGAVQHNVGMQGSDYIVAINRDPDAPIFKIASFGIVGDLFEVVPALIEQLKTA
ncbi:MAG: electron transfer flavoprotein subunit alpha/FixB family protein [Thermomicrobiales bacterium]